MATEAALNPAAATSGWRDRLGARAQAVVVLIILVMTLPLVANAYLAGQYSPAGAARQYLLALQAGDSTQAWSLIGLAPPAVHPDATLLTQKALAASLAGSRPTYPGLTVGNTAYSGPSATVGVSYARGSATRQLQLNLVQTSERRLFLYPVWKVVITPALLSVTLPVGSTGASVDGQRVSLAAGKSQTIAAFPLVHRFQMLGGGLVEASAQSVDASESGSAPVAVAVSPTLTSSGAAATRLAVREALTACVTKVDLQPRDCPQSSTASLVDQIHWELVGDPTTDMAVAFGADGTATVTGHFQMILSDHPSYGLGVEHHAVGGAYKAAIQFSSDGVKAGPIVAANGVPGVVRPVEATDQAAKDLVKTAFAACAAATSGAVNDCPQLSSLVIGGDAKNVRWTLSADPLAGAAVAFDGNRSVINVTGDFAMAADFDLRGSHFHGDSQSKRYTADLFWNGTALQLVTIRGLLA